MVDRAAAGRVMARVRGASAHYMPIRGGAVPLLDVGRRAGIDASSRYDLSYYGGPTVTSESAYDLYVNCSSFSGCWGAPGTFLGNLASTSFIHLLDQYTGSTMNNRYTYAGGIAESYNTSGTLQDQDIYNIVYAAASANGTGYGHIYHVFLAAGVQQCSQSAGGCYAQQYCAYHGAVDFSDIGHTLYTVEPYQGINGCMSPNSKLADSTNSTLSHEYYETITDPDVQTNVAWYNNNYGEIGDICRNSYGYTTVGGVRFDIQKEYSNRYHACSFSP
ncbi:MAG: hypothetical protein GIW94_04615 [Candidatus Eremiobacteraeota bacterium]|nr:hypothetical protein [Candidatus Eremiobacteraeota bacterium]MBC5823161.1 hypothetical protein [Candidatus Eremiobacteraeota bacterium]